MATSNIKLFDENKGNMMGDTEYGTNTQRLNGVQQGIASSQLNNKFSYQTSLVAYALAQIMMQNGFNANDSDAVTTFVSNMSSTLLQKVTDKANKTMAEAGTDDSHFMTPLQVKNAINSIVPLLDSIASTSTKQLYGLGAEATPNDILSILSDSALYKTNGLYTVTNDLIMSLPGIQIYTGSYTGTGTGTVTLTFPVEPTLVIAGTNPTSNGSQYLLILTHAMSGLRAHTLELSNNGSNTGQRVDSFMVEVVSFSGNSVTFGSLEYPASQNPGILNTSGTAYYYIAI